jgi:hypothetical protein
VKRSINFVQSRSCRIKSAGAFREWPPERAR